jgi:hypothetical protein
LAIRPLPPEPNPSWSGKAPDPATSRAPWRLYNVGNSHPVEVLELVRVIEQVIGRPAIREFLPMQPGDVLETCADSSTWSARLGFDQIHQSKRARDCSSNVYARIGVARSEHKLRHDQTCLG